jgi:hypothetical protein
MTHENQCFDDRSLSQLSHECKRLVAALGTLNFGVQVFFVCAPQGTDSWEWLLPSPERRRAGGTFITSEAREDTLFGTPSWSARCFYVQANNREQLTSICSLLQCCGELLQELPAGVLPFQVVREDHLWPWLACLFKLAWLPGEPRITATRRTWISDPRRVIPYDIEQVRTILKAELEPIPPAWGEELPRHFYAEINHVEIASQRALEWLAARLEEQRASLQRPAVDEIANHQGMAQPTVEEDQCAPEGLGADGQTFLSASAIAKKLNMNPERVESALRRFRKKFPDCCQEADGRRRNEPQYLYRLADVMPCIEKLRGRQ